MVRPVLFALLVAACDVGIYDGAGGGGGGGAPDAAGGGGGGGGGGSPDAAAGGGGGTARLQITATSSPTPNAVYAPNNVVAIWIEAQGGAFVKTIGRWADIRRQNLIAWTGKAGLNDVDAVTGATRTSHQTPLTLMWDLTNRQGQVVPDGTYTVRMESADLNTTTAAQNNQATFTFIKGPQPQMQTGLANGRFSAVSINFTP